MNRFIKMEGFIAMKRLLIMVMCLVLTGCALFKKTTKARTEAKAELNRQAELNKLAVKMGQKETNVVTYWPDGSVYKWENILEQVDEARYGKLTVKEKAAVKKEGAVVQSVPSFKWWVGLGGVLLLVGIIFAGRLGKYFHKF